MKKDPGMESSYAEIDNTNRYGAPKSLEEIERAEEEASAHIGAGLSGHASNQTYRDLMFANAHATHEGASNVSGLEWCVDSRPGACDVKAWINGKHIDETDAWKARLRHGCVPAEAIPPSLKRKFDEANADKQRFRRASSSLSSISSMSIAKWDAAGPSTKRSAQVVPLGPST